METFRAHDYFAPIATRPFSNDAQAVPGTFPPLNSLIIHALPLGHNGLSSLEPADRYTYIIMGLAVLIAIVVPLLNLN